MPHNIEFVIAAYGITFLVIFLYLFTIGWKNRYYKHKIETLKNTSNNIKPKKR